MQLNKTGLLSSVIFLSVILGACASRILKYEKEEGLKKIDEFDAQVKIVIPEEKKSSEAKAAGEAKKEESKASSTDGIVAGSSSGTPVPNAGAISSPELADKADGKKKKKISKKKSDKTKGLERRQPDLESDIGFAGRRPIMDPFRVGEKVTHTVTWAGISAGGLSFEVKDFAEVNDSKSYQFEIRVWTNSFFSSIYSVDDRLETLVDFETLVPSVFSLHVQHTTELREARAFFDRKKSSATYWEKKVTSYDGEQEKKIQWDIPDYSQNVYSGLFYMRNFQWEVGREHAFRVGDNNENLVFRAKAIRKEKISTDAGEFNTIVVKPQVELRGIAKPVGDMFIWLSDDDRKFILKIESKVKIGTFVTEVSKLQKGEAP